MYSAIIPASGTGSRMGFRFNKLLYKINDMTILEYTARTFLEDARCKQIILTVNHKDFDKISQIFASSTKVQIEIGSKTRQESIYNGMQVVTEDFVLIHDGARPFITESMISSCLKVLDKDRGAVLGFTPKDTIKLRKKFDPRFIESTLIRDELVAVQTPQCFPTSPLKEANEKAFRDGFLPVATDDAMIFEKYTDIPIEIVEHNEANPKFTTPDDVEYFEFLLKKRRCYKCESVILKMCTN